MTDLPKHPRTGENDLASIDDVFRSLNRPIWIVTAATAIESANENATEGTAGNVKPTPQRGGLVATWISQASIDADRPVVSAGIAPNHFTRELVDTSKAFVLHLLRPDQAMLAYRFCSSSGRTVDKLEGLESTKGANGSPILLDCHSHLDCQVVARLDGGDRIYYWAEVVAGRKHSQGELLTEHIFFSALNNEQLNLLRADRERDVREQFPLWETWRNHLPPHLDPNR